MRSVWCNKRILFGLFTICDSEKSNNENQTISYSAFLRIHFVCPNTQNAESACLGACVPWSVDDGQQIWNHFSSRLFPFVLVCVRTLFGNTIHKVSFDQIRSAAVDAETGLAEQAAATHSNHNFSVFCTMNVNALCFAFHSVAFDFMCISLRPLKRT